MARSVNRGLVSVAAYARHRGISAAAVTHAIRKGRLDACIERDERGKPKIKSVEAADAEWARSMAPPSHPSGMKHGDETGDEIKRLPPLAISRAKYQQAKTQIAEMELLKKQRELVPVALVQSHVADMFAHVRTRLLSLPTDARQRIPQLGDVEVGVIEELVREALEQLAEERVGDDD